MASITCGICLQFKENETICFNKIPQTPAIQSEDKNVAYTQKLTS